jgi:hypothetical protein
MDASRIILNTILVAIALIMIFILSRPRFLKSETWQATLTPLSSIIGSGFLVMAPLLASIVGISSPWAVLGIVLLAYSIGSVIRFNILHVEPRSEQGKLARGAREIEYLGNIALALAYMVAVAFYLSLLSSFSLNYLNISSPLLERSLTTIMICIIAATGYFKGLNGLEKMESLSMTIQLSIVVALITALVVFGIQFLSSGESIHFHYQHRSVPVQFQMLAGALLIVQGFETSRFLGEKYSSQVRISSMRYAQMISGIIYVIAVTLFMPIVQKINLMDIELSQIIDITGLAATALPLMLIIAAIMSQFSAAVADTGGAGGLFHEGSQQRLSSNISYIIVSACAIFLVWDVNLLTIITLASRAFATYYFLQTLLALYYCYMDYPQNTPTILAKKVFFVLLALILAYVIVFAIPAE